MNPWEYLRNWEMCDRTNEQSTIEYINTKMQSKWPGEYVIVKRFGFVTPGYAIVFGDPREELMFTLKWA